MIRVTKEELMNVCHNGTVFIPLGNPKSKFFDVCRRPEIITDKYNFKPGWTWTIPLVPEPHLAYSPLYDEEDGFIAPKEAWATFDCTDSDDLGYEKEEMFAILSKKEIEGMIAILQYCLDPESNYIPDEYFNNYFLDDSTEPKPVEEMPKW